MKWLLPRGFLVRGKVKVGDEVSLAHFGYNLKRALAIVGLEKLLAALEGWKPKPEGGTEKGVMASVAVKVGETIQYCCAMATSCTRRLHQMWRASQDLEAFPATI